MGRCSLSIIFFCLLFSFWWYFIIISECWCILWIANTEDRTLGFFSPPLSPLFFFRLKWNKQRTLALKNAKIKWNEFEKNGKKIKIPKHKFFCRLLLKSRSSLYFSVGIFWSRKLNFHFPIIPYALTSISCMCLSVCVYMRACLCMNVFCAMLLLLRHFNRILSYLFILYLLVLRVWRRHSR